MLLDNIYSNRLCYSTMYMSVATGKNISIYILVRLSLEYYVLLRRWEINVRASLEGDVQNILYTRASYIWRFGILSQTRDHYNQFGILQEQKYYT